MSKLVTVKTYAPSGTFLGVLDGCRVEEVGQSLDGGVAETVFLVPAQFGAEGEAWAEGNRIEVSVSDGETTGDASPEPGASVLLFSGTVTRIVRETSSRGSEVTLGALGDQHLLRLDILRSGAQTTLYSKATDGLTTVSGDQSAADIGEIARAVTDAFITANPSSRIHYLDGDIPDVGIDVAYTFEAMTVADALDTLKGMASGLHWFVDPTGRLTFGAAGTGTSHSLTFGREITSARMERSLEQTVNSWLVWDGQAAGIYKDYEDAASVSDIGRRMGFVSDSGLAGSDAVDALGARLLAERKDATVRLTLEVADSSASGGYDIETLRPGDTVRLMGFDADVADWVFRGDMLITGVRWLHDRAIVSIDANPSGMVSQSASVKREVASLAASGVPESYT